MEDWMKRFPSLILACFLLICLGFACEKTRDPRVDEVAFSEALPEIPASYGDLKAVTSVPQYRGWFQMWFEDDVGTIRIVRVEIFKNQMPGDIKVIKRTLPEVEEVLEDEG
jgi:hypothetical protein